MRYVQCGDLRSSVLGFGCGGVMGRVSRRQSLRAMHLAFDAGINLFDTARSYGYGDAESVLGEFLQTRREQLLISTKFGILPHSPSRLKRLAKPPVRTLLKLIPSARGLIRRAAAIPSAGGHFTVTDLRTSLHESLRQLRTPYVDFLFLHEAPASAMQQDDLMAELDTLKHTGKLRNAGASCDPTVTTQLLAEGPPSPITALQFPTNLVDMRVTTAASRTTQRNLFLVANHPFGGANGIAATQQKLTTLLTGATLQPALREKLRDAPLHALLPEVLFALILHGTGIHALVPSMLHEKNLRSNLAAVDSTRFTADDIAVLRGHLIATRETQ